MPDFLYIIGFILGIGLLILGAEMFTDAVVDTAKKFRVSILMLGLLVAGAEPEEMLASAVASGKGMAGIALGNVLGTNIAIIGGALALGAIVAPIETDKKSQRHGWIALAFSILPIAFMLNGTVYRWEGILLAFLFLLYIWYIVQKEKIDVELEDATAAELLSHSESQTGEIEDDEDKDESLWKVIGLIILGTTLMGIGSELLLMGVDSIMQWLHLSETVVGLTFVSLATSAEMIALAIAPIYKGYPEITIGGIIGSYAYNIMITLGVAAVVHPLTLTRDLQTLDLPAMLGFYLLMMVFTYKGKLTKANGGMLLGLYLIYLVYNFAFR